MPIGKDVREERVVDDLHAVTREINEKQRREQVATVDDVGHHDQEIGVVATRDKPLLTAQPEAPVNTLRDRLDPRRVGAGIALRDGVGIRPITCERRLEVRVDLLGRTERENVVSATHQPPETIGDAPEFLVHDDVLHHLPALTAVLDGVIATDQA